MIEMVTYYRDREIKREHPGSWSNARKLIANRHGNGKWVRRDEWQSTSDGTRVVILDASE